MDSLKQVASALHAIGDATGGDVLVALLLASTLTMAVLQAFKETTSIRENFQRAWVSWWLKRKDSRAKSPGRGERREAKKTLEEKGLTAPQQLLIDLATGGDDNALYSLPTEQLVAQMAAASQIVLDYPERPDYALLLEALALGADAADIALVVGTPNARALAASGQTLPDGYVDARNRVSHRIQRNLDGLQISMSYRWQLNLQIASIGVSIAFIEIAIGMLAPNPEEIAPYVAGLLVGLVGGYFAPVARDLIVALQNLRAK